MRNSLLIITYTLSCCFTACSTQSPSDDFVYASPAAVKITDLQLTPSIHSIGNIPLPDGYTRMEPVKNSFAHWLQHLPLKRENLVHLYNGQLKPDQSWHYAVLDISTGNRDLQQCADALMRLRAEYLFSIKAFDQLNFVTGNGTTLSFREFAMGERYALRGQKLSRYHAFNDLSCYTHDCLMRFLDWVFGYCSTYSLALQTTPVKLFTHMQPGDMLVRAGSPGHAMMVGDVAVNAKTGDKIYLLIQSYMPAQDMHIVKNLSDRSLGPWYRADVGKRIITPGYMFETTQLRRWK
jgi:hypothetical protein